MKISKQNTEAVVKNMRAEGHQSRADYLEMMQNRISELEEELRQYRNAKILCWDAENPEDAQYDEQGVAEHYADNMNNDESQAFYVMRALSLPDKEMIVTLSGGDERIIDWEWVEDTERPGVKGENA